MSKIMFKFDAKNGSSIAETGQTPSSNSVKFIKTEKGLTLSKGDVTYPSILEHVYAGKSFTIISIVKFPKLKAGSYLVFNSIVNFNRITQYAANLGSPTFYTYINYTGVSDSVGNYIIIPYTIKQDTWYFSVLTYDFQTKTLILKINNVLVNKTTNLNIVINNLKLNTTIGGNSSTYYSYLSQILIDNRVITDFEINKIYQNFLNSRPTLIPTQFRPNLNIYKPSILQENGLIAAYNFKPSGNKLINIAAPSNNNSWLPGQYNGTIIKCSSLSTSLQFHGRGYVNINSLILNGAKFVWCGVFETLQSGVNCNFGNGTSPTNGFLIGVFTDNLFYIQFPGNLIYGFTSIQPGFHTFVAVYDGTQLNNQSKCVLYLDGVKKTLGFSNSTIPNSVNTTGWKIGSAMGGYLSNFCKIFDHRIYNRILSEKEIKDYHNSFVSSPVLQEDFSQYAAGSKPNNWRIKSGTWKVGEYVDRSKYLECLTAGVIGIPSKNAYGIWEFDFYRGGTGNTLFINFIANTLAGGIAPVGYQVFLTDQVRFVRLNGGTDNIISNTPLNYISSKIKYSFRLTRKTDGVIEFYIKGGTFGTEYRIVPKTLQGGFIPIIDNTYKSSNYFVLDMDAGDRVSNLKIYPGITV